MIDTGHCTTALRRTLWHGFRRALDVGTPARSTESPVITERLGDFFAEYRVRSSARRRPLRHPGRRRRTLTIDHSAAATACGRSSVPVLDGTGDSTLPTCLCWCAIPPPVHRRPRPHSILRAGWREGAGVCCNCGYSQARTATAGTSTGRPGCTVYTSALNLLHRGRPPDPPRHVAKPGDRCSTGTPRHR